MTHFGVVGVLLALAISACASPSPALHSLPQGYALGEGPAAVVVGRVTIDLDPKPIEFFDKLDEISLILANSLGSFEIVCDQSGSDSYFFIALPPGEYTVSQMVKGNQVSSIGGRFTAVKGQVTYLGTLKFTNEGFWSSVAESMVSGRTSITGRWAVEDDYEASVATLGSRYPQITQPVAKSLVILP